MATIKARLDKAATRAFAQLATARGYVPEAIGRQGIPIIVDAAIDTLRTYGLDTEEVRHAVCTVLKSAIPTASSVTGFEAEALVHGWWPACAIHCELKLFAKSVAAVLSRYGHDPDVIREMVLTRAQRCFPPALPPLAVTPSYGCGQSCAAWPVASGEGEGGSDEHVKTTR